MAHYRITFALAIFTLYQQQNAISAEEAQNVFLYPGKAVSERNLQLCGEREVCSIVHKRFFYPKSVERFCRCADKECPSSWVDPPDNYTMHANNRAQMKFCEPITDLPNCVDNNETTPLYLTITNKTSNARLENEAAETVENYQITSKASCYCPQHHMWKCSSLETNSSSETTVEQYRCAPLDKCKADNFCGSERSDYFSVYYHCSCPTDHYCVRKDNFQFLAREIFYDGPAYRALCTNFPDLHKSH